MTFQMFTLISQNFAAQISYQIPLSCACILTCNWDKRNIYAACDKSTTHGVSLTLSGDLTFGPIAESMQLCLDNYWVKCNRVNNMETAIMVRPIRPKDK